MLIITSLLPSLLMIVRPDDRCSILQPAPDESKEIIDQRFEEMAGLCLKFAASVVAESALS
jgi:hypothetical protein